VIDIYTEGVTVLKFNKLHFHIKVYFPCSTVCFMYFEYLKFPVVWNPVNYICLETTQLFAGLWTVAAIVVNKITSVIIGTLAVFYVSCGKDCFERVCNF